MISAVLIRPPFPYLLVVAPCTVPHNLGSKVALDRTMDVFKLQELSDDPDPNSTLPFISHHTLNISRELDDDKGNHGIDCP